MARSPHLLLVADHSGLEAEFVASHSDHRRSSLALSLARDARLRERSLRAFARLLNRDGFSVQLAYGTGAFGSLVTDPSVDGIIVDLTTADARWLAAARYARSFLVDVPLIFVTAHIEQLEAAVRALAPPIGVFSKPLDYPACLGELRRLLGIQERSPGPAVQTRAGSPGNR